VLLPTTAQPTTHTHIKLGPLPPPLQTSQPTYKHKSGNQKGQAKRRKHKSRRKYTRKPVFDDTKNKSKTRQNLRQIHYREISPKKHTKHDTNEKDLYRQLETLVQDHIENQLKHRHNGQQPYKRFSRRPSNTDLHIYTGTSYSMFLFYSTLKIST
jgi:type IV secretory pathway VirB10-like protein